MFVATVGWIAPPPSPREAEAVCDAIPGVTQTFRCSGHSRLLACIDRLFAIDGSCGTAAAEPFMHFTALPPNDYHALCIDADPSCTGTAPELRFTVDAGGNILVPMDWRGILVGEAIPVARLLRGSTTADLRPRL